jgi:hypothetical protein
MTRALALVLFLVAAPAVADSTPSTPAADATAPAAKPATCKKVVVGKGLDRKVVCEVEAEIPVRSSAPRPNVVIVHQSPRQVVGRPKSGNRLNGLSQRLR